MVDTKLFAMDGPRGTGSGHPLFGVRQARDADGAVRMTLVGELDLSATAGLRARLDEAQHAKRRVRLDLSELEFIDCSGIRAILDALAQARREGAAMEVDKTVSPIVGRLVSLGRISADLWPSEPAGHSPNAAAA